MSISEWLCVLSHNHNLSIEYKIPINAIIHAPFSRHLSIDLISKIPISYHE